MIRSNRIPAAIAAVCSLVWVAGRASSPDAPPATAGYASTAQIEGDPDRMVCKRQKETGSRLSSRVCKTAREWEQERLDNQEAIRNATRSGMRPTDMPSAGGG
jgi:hypothetical protein